jgi:hypothetical protein
MLLVSQSTEESFHPANRAIVVMKQFLMIFGSGKLHSPVATMMGTLKIIL